MKTRILFGSVLLIAGSLLTAPAVHAEDPKGRWEVKGTLGLATFPDEDFLHHFVAGGSTRIYLTRRFGFEPELQFMYRDRTDSDIVFIPNVTWDFTRRQGRLQPYAIGGVGFLRHYENYGDWSWAANTWTFGAGFGVKWFLNERVFIAPEVRLGWEPFLRISGSVGWILSK